MLDNFIAKVSNVLFLRQQQVSPHGAGEFVGDRVVEFSGNLIYYRRTFIDQHAPYPRLDGNSVFEFEVIRQPFGYCFISSFFFRVGNAFHPFV